MVVGRQGREWSRRNWVEDVKQGWKSRLWSAWGWQRIYRRGEKEISVPQQPQSLLYDRTWFAVQFVLVAFVHGAVVENSNSMRCYTVHGQLAPILYSSVNQLYWQGKTALKDLLFKKNNSKLSSFSLLYFMLTMHCSLHSFKNPAPMLIAEKPQAFNREAL